MLRRQRRQYDRSAPLQSFVWPVGVLKRLLIACAMAMISQGTAADTLATLSSLCASAGNLNRIGLMAAEATLNGISGSTINPLITDIKIKENEIVASTGHRDRYLAQRAPMGDSVDVGSGLIAREAEQAKQRWNDQYRDELQRLGASADEEQAKYSAQEAEVTRKRSEYNTANTWLATFFRRDRLKQLAAELAALEKSLAAQRATRDDAQGALAERRGALNQQLAAEDESRNRRLAEHRARWDALTAEYEKYRDRVNLAGRERAKLQGDLAALQLGITEARKCLKSARANLDRGSSQRGSADGYDPRSDPGSGSSEPRLGDAGRVTEGFGAGVPAPTTSGSRGGEPQVAMTPPISPSTAGQGTIPYCPPNLGMPNTGVLGYACLPAPSTQRAPPQPGTVIPFPGTQPAPMGRGDSKPPHGPGGSVPSTPGKPPTAAANPPTTVGPSAPGPASGPLAPPASSSAACTLPLCTNASQKPGVNCQAWSGDFMTECVRNMTQRCMEGTAQGRTGDWCVRKNSADQCASHARSVCESSARQRGG